MYWEDVYVRVVACGVELGVGAKTREKQKENPFEWEKHVQSWLRGRDFI